MYDILMYDNIVRRLHATPIEPLHLIGSLSNPSRACMVTPCQTLTDESNHPKFSKEVRRRQRGRNMHIACFGPGSQIWEAANPSTEWY